MEIKEILSKVSFEFNTKGKDDVDIVGLTLDSKKVEKDFCFFAVVGENQDGHDFIDEAIQNGASIIFCQDFPTNINENVLYIQTPNTRDIVSNVASLFYDEPSKKLRVIGVTGTNGKTTTATIIYKALTAFMMNVSLMSTNQDIIKDEIYPEKRKAPTTPDPIFVQKFIYDSLNAGCQYVVMEVTSHSTVQHRVDGVCFSRAIFTNLTHDHLDYHFTMENYANAKKMFFDMLDKESFAIVNIDDEYGRFMVRDTKANVLTYGFSNLAEYNKIIESKLIGRFNNYNMLAVYTLLRSYGFEDKNIKSILKNILPPEGRFELVFDKNNMKVIVDYAHTPDAIQNTINSAKDLLKQNGRIITIVGSGGDRDPFKRPLMARISYDLSDILIITSDNPRYEDPEKIIDDMKKGLPENEEKELYFITDRKEAILQASKVIREFDIVLVLGKGHEKYQEIKGVKEFFDDKVEILNVFK